MTDNRIDHGAISAERTINAPVAEADQAFADAKQREAWAAPSETATFFYEQADFRVGGLDVARCGAKSDPRFRVETRYLHIVPMQRIVSVETIQEMDRPLAANLTTVEFAPDGPGTRIKVIVQVTSFAGQTVIDNTEAGHAGSLANMTRYLEAREVCGR
jgi:uncharacterized protein YndB with AHSA1/START domain